VNFFTLVKTERAGSFTWGTNTLSAYSTSEFSVL
jgi:hypothetical protein